MNAVVTRPPINTAVSAVMQRYMAQQAAAAEELGAGVSGGFAIVGYRGKTWSIKHRGNEQIINRADGDGPKQTLEFVIVRASPHIAKIYYKDGYVAGSTAPPDCWSVNGVAPDPASPAKQCTTCAGCPMNAWGSKITDAGKQAKACADSKRLAVVPLDNLRNEAYGGAMLLRVPAASLGDMKQYNDRLMERGFPYFAVGTKIKFDPAESFPKFVFEPYRALTDDEAQVIIDMRESEHVKRLLSAAVDEVKADTATPGAVDTSVATQQGNPAPDPAALAAAQAAAAAAAAAKQAAERAAVEAQAKALMEQQAKDAAAAIARAAADAQAKAAAEAVAQQEANRLAAEVAAREAAARAAAVTSTAAPAGDGFFTMGQPDDTPAVTQGAAVGGVTGAPATPVAANTQTASTASAAAGAVVDAEYKEVENGAAAAPADFDNLLDSLLATPVK